VQQVSNVGLEGVVGRARAAGAQYSRREIPFEAGPGAPLRVLDVTVTPFDPPGRSGGVLVELADTTHHQRITRENAPLTQPGGNGPRAHRVCPRAASLSIEIPWRDRW